MAVRGWHLGTATDVCSAWIWTSARRASSVSSYTHTVTQEYLLAQIVEKQCNCTNHKLEKSIRANLNVSVCVCVFNQVVPSLRAMRMTMRW